MRKSARSVVITGYLGTVHSGESSKGPPDPACDRHSVPPVPPTRNMLRQNERGACRPSRRNASTRALLQGGTRFRPGSFTGQQRFGYPFRDADRPIMVVIVPVHERYQKTGVRDGLHLREKPLRVERSAVLQPHQPGEGMGALGDPGLLEFLPDDSALGTPVLRAASFNHSARSSGTRTVIVLLICSECNTDAALLGRRRSPVFTLSYLKFYFHAPPEPFLSRAARWLTFGRPSPSCFQSRFLRSAGPRAGALLASGEKLRLPRINCRSRYLCSAP